MVSFQSTLQYLAGARVARDEINNRTDLLPGYHIELIVGSVESCSSRQAGIGLSNLVKYTVSPPCHPVVAVNGLGCSSHTSVISRVAGHDGYDLIQLSGSNSPIFEIQNHRFPHLWQFLGSATVYTDAILAIMDQYNWTRIGVVFNSGSLFHSEIARNLEQAMVSMNKTTLFSLGMRGTRDFYLNTAITKIRNEQATILVSLLNINQETALTSRAIAEKLVYPAYTWIHVENLPQNFRIGRGHIFLHTQTYLPPDTVLVSGETFSTFRNRTDEDTKLIEEQYKHCNLTPSVFANTWYDQVWAIALAVNNSLPVLENRNLSIDNYTIGQPEITDVIEEQMANLSFQGAGGWVEFNKHRSVSALVEVYWISGNGTEKEVGLYKPMNSSNFHVAVSPNDLPNDRLPSQIVFDVIPIGVAILLYILTGAVIMFTTVQLILYLYYRNHKVIKATSSFLSLLIFTGCYLFCIAAVSTITQISHVLAPKVYTILIYIFLLSAVNGASLTLITLFIKLLRVFQIFHLSSRIKKGRKYLKSCHLFHFILLLSVIPNIILLPTIIIEAPDRLEFYSSVVKNRIELHVHVLQISLGTGHFISLMCVLGYLSIFLLLTVFLAIRTRNITYKNFKDTKKINLFIAVLFITVTLGCSVCAILILSHEEAAGRIVLIISLLILPTACQAILFLPKTLPVLCARFKAKLSGSKLSVIMTRLDGSTTSYNL